MSRLLVALSILAVAAAAIAADRLPQQLHRKAEWIHGNVVGMDKAEVDTVYLLGGPDRLDGRFEDAAGNPAWNGWTHEDDTYDPSAYWNISDFMAPAGNYAMWCGTVYDGNPGYGNNWNQSLFFTHHVADPAAAATVTWAAILRNDTEPAYDYTHLQVNRGGDWEDLQVVDGEYLLQIDEVIDLEPGDYVGENADEIQLRVLFTSDGAWSDYDGLWDTDGACQLDDVSVTIDGVLVDFEDFEDQVSDRWHQVVAPGVGDFAALWTGLQDVDPCVSNYTPQLAFIDDGVVVPGTGGSHCITWCYGPGGYIVNNTGGLLGPEHHISNNVQSPVLDWPAGCDAAEIRYDNYRHEEAGAFGTWPGISLHWGVRATDDPVNDPIESTYYRDRDSGIHFGGPDYIRRHQIVTDLLGDDRVQVQMRVRCWEFGYIFGWIGVDGTPAPYVDNVAFLAWPFAGPQIRARAIDLFNDGFPALGHLDLDDLAANSVRLDAAQNIARQTDLVNYPGDSIWFDIAIARAGAVLEGMPRLHVRMKANHVFDGVRMLPPNFTQSGAFIDGWVYGDSTFSANDDLINDRYNFDLPDEGFFFPGDVLHYYVEASDNQYGDIGTTIIPADTSGFASFNDRYDRDFIVRALPSVHSTTPGDQPSVVFWQDAIDRGGHDEWLIALAQLGYRRGVHYDMYATNGPSSGVGNGLGGRATAELLSGYSSMLYTSGTLTVNLLANGDFENDPSNDLVVVSDWFVQGGKNAFMTGDDLVTGLLDAGIQGSAFVSTYLGASHVDRDLRELIGGQSTPTVLAVPGNGIIDRVPIWTAFGGCPRLNRFDAVVAGPQAVRIAEFTDPGENPGIYPYAAALYHHEATQDARVVLMPVDFMHIYNKPGWVPPPGHDGIAARAIILDDVLTFFGEEGGFVGIGDAPPARLLVATYPNPFNPTTTIALELARAGDVSLKIYDIRGALVCTLVGERLPAGRHEIVWNGTDGQGAAVASGVYFSEVRAAGEVKVQKLALVK